MATKQRNIELPSESRQTKRSTLVPTLIRHPIWGDRECLPIKKGKDITPMVIPMPPAETSVLTDETPSPKADGLVIHNCTHSRFVYRAPTAIERLWRNATYVCRRDVNSDELVYYNTGISNDLWPCAEMMNGAVSRSMVNGLTSYSSIPASIMNQIPAPERGRLPAMVLAKAKELSLNQTLAELHSVPGLFECYNLRKQFEGYSKRWLEHQRKLADIANIPGYAAKLRNAKTVRLRRELWKRITKAAAGSYLGTIFGLIPTVQEAYLMAQKCAEGFKARKKQYVASLRTTATLYNNPAHWDDADTHGIVLQESFEGVRVEGVVLTDRRPAYHSDRFQQWADRMDASFGLNGAGSILEILPFSFCVDWLISLDDVIDSLFLRTTDSFSAQYWSSIKGVVNGSVSGSVLTKIEGTYPGPQISTERRVQGGSYTVTNYTRSRAEAPMPLESIRYRLTTGTSFTGIMIALGFL